MNILNITKAPMLYSHKVSFLGYMEDLYLLERSEHISNMDSVNQTIEYINTIKLYL